MQQMMSETPGSDYNYSCPQHHPLVVSEKAAEHSHFCFTRGLWYALNSSVHLVWAGVKAHLNLKSNKPCSETPKHKND